MKNKFVLIALFICSGLHAQGKLAGSYGALINKRFTDEKQLTSLYGFTYRGGSVIGDSADPRGLSVSWYMKGPIIVALFESKKADAAVIQIVDVLEIRNIQKDQELSIGVCQDGENVMPGLVALVQPSEAKRYKALKAWNFNPEKLMIEPWPQEKISCLGAVGED